MEWHTDYNILLLLFKILKYISTVLKDIPIKNAENHLGFRHLARQKGFEPPTFRLGERMSLLYTVQNVLNCAVLSG